MAPRIETILIILSALAGIVSTLLGIVKSYLDVRKNLKFSISRNNLIFLMLGIILLLLSTLVFARFGCHHPEVRIKEPLGGAWVDNPISVQGNAMCLPENYRIALLIHRIAQNNNPDAWFINNECASIERNKKWKLASTEIGTENSKGCRFEIYAYALPDSVCNRLLIMVNDKTYQGSVKRPQLFQGVFDVVNVTRR
jgi:hypothetical protein